MIRLLRALLGLREPESFDDVLARSLASVTPAQRAGAFQSLNQSPNRVVIVTTSPEPR